MFSKYDLSCQWIVKHVWKIYGLSITLILACILYAEYYNNDIFRIAYKIGYNYNSKTEQNIIKLKSTEGTTPAITQTTLTSSSPLAINSALSKFQSYEKLSVFSRTTESFLRTEQNVIRLKPVEEILKTPPITQTTLTSLSPFAINSTFAKFQFYERLTVSLSTTKRFRIPLRTTPKFIRQTPNTWTTPKTLNAPKTLMTPPKTKSLKNSTLSESTLTYECEDFVVFSQSFTDGRGVGNQIFNLAAGILTAKITNRRIAVNGTHTKEIFLEDVFDYNYERFNRNDCQLHVIQDAHNLGYNPKIEKLLSDSENKLANKTLTLQGFFQSWKYALDENLLRQKYLIFKKFVKQAVESFFNFIKPENWETNTYVRVAVHIRRGDVLTDHSVKFGYTTPSTAYFENAMLYMLRLFKKVQFIIVTNDRDWCRKEIVPEMFQTYNYTAEIHFNITYSNFDANQAIDLAILSMSHHTIISTGTFGWWGAWLCRGITVYYKNWPRPNSSLAEQFIKEDFFPPYWIGMGD